MATLEDSTHLKLDEPLDLDVGSIVVLEILDHEISDLDGEFLIASRTMLERAYGENEPDYSDSGTPIN